ncbi:MAG TPA: condensation domain-containing protein, partial [Candidatus Deferrimicrobium sp.]|nr:condensation domain-containing protein [Candidatus Deferrimicrobium sp.]
LNKNDRILQLSNYAFDGSVFDIYGALLNGAALVLVERETVSAVNRSAELIKREQVTVFFITTALFNTLVDLELTCLENIRKVLFGGERVSVAHSRKALAVLGKGKIIHVYGPTETTVYATYYFIDYIGEETLTIPIGKPIANTTIYILDKYLNPVPTGVSGEIYIGGDGVARGYLNNPELTAKNFNRSYRSYQTYICYKTGDLARWLPDGNIEFLGRIDQQVKIRGFRVEIGEIESRILKWRDVKEVFVTAVDNRDGEKSLAAYIVMAGPAADKLYDYLQEQLPAFMIPSYIIPVAKIPLTPNGKVDRKALPEPGMTISPVGAPPRDETEKKLAALWAELLGIEKDALGIDSDFFKLGGHSLRAVRLTARIHKEFNVTITVTEIFKKLSIRNLARLIQGQVKEQFTGVAPVEKKEYYPASPMQKRLFLIAQMEGVDIAYNLAQAYIIEGEVNRERFEQTFQKLIRRHESLRTSFTMVDDQTVQRIHDRLLTNVFAELFSKSDPPEAIIKSFIRPFDLSSAPLLRAQLVELSPGKYLFLYDIHHIISDGTSRGIFLQDFMIYYEGKDEPLPPLNIQYKDFCCWQNNRREKDQVAFEKKEKYWLERFSGEIPRLGIYTDYPRSATQSFAGERISFIIEKGGAQRIREFMKENGTTLLMFLLAVYNILLARYSGQEDIVVGVPTAGREHVDLENVIGVFINALAMRNQPQRDKTFLEFLGEVKKNTIAAYENQGYPFGELIEKVAAIEDYSRNPIFEVELLVQNMEMPEWKMAGLTLKPYEYPFGAAQVDLALEVWELEERILFNLVYCSVLFKKSTMERFATCFRDILTMVLDNPGIELKNIILSHDLQFTRQDIYRETQTNFEF